MPDESGSRDKQLSIKSLRDDEPIRTIERDLLSRDQLVEALARQIEATDTHQPIVIGLNAPWGTGKSSFLYLVSARLESGPREPDQHSGDDRSQSHPIIINFNPWLYGNVEQLIRIFFAQLATKIGAESGKSKLGKLLKEFGPLIASLCPVAPPGTATLTESIGGLLDKKGIPDRKQDIDEQLESLRQRVIVFVDDIDRLEPDVTELLFRMVRLCADFKNITYVLAFDSTVVERHLDSGDRASGRRYLEKIIHVSYNIPRPGRTALRTILTEELDDVRRIITPDPLNVRRYETMFIQEIEQHFSTVRGIKRYVNALRLSLPPVKDKIDLIDFFAIELIRVAYPEVYAILSANRYRLIGESCERETPDDDSRDWLEQLLKPLTMPSNVETSLMQLICGLFPELRGSKAGDGKRTRWARERRVCCRQTIDQYFLFTMPSEQLSVDDRTRFRKEAKKAAAVVDNGFKEMKRVIRKWSRIAGKKGRIGGLMETLCELTSEIGKSTENNLGAASVEKIARVICTIDPEDDLRLRDGDNDGTLLGKIVHECTTHQKGINQVDFLKDLIEYKSLFTVTKVFQYLSKYQKLSKYGGVSDKVKKQLGKKLGNRILEEARVDKFWRSYRWHYLLSVDWKVGEENNVMQFEIKRAIDLRVKAVIAERIRAPEGLLRFCESCRDFIAYREEKGDGVKVLNGIKHGIREWLPNTFEGDLESLQQDSTEEGTMAAEYQGLLVTVAAE